MTQEQQHQVEDLNDQMLVRRQKMEQLREDGIDPFGKRFERTHNSEELHELFDPRTKEELAEMGLTASVAGRMMTRRGKGKTAVQRPGYIPGSGRTDCQVSGGIGRDWDRDLLCGGPSKGCQASG